MEIKAIPLMENAIFIIIEVQLVSSELVLKLARQDPVQKQYHIGIVLVLQQFVLHPENFMQVIPGYLILRIQKYIQGGPMQIVQIRHSMCNMNMHFSRYQMTWPLIPVAIFMLPEKV